MRNIFFICIKTKKNMNMNVCFGLLLCLVSFQLSFAQQDVYNKQVIENVSKLDQNQRVKRDSILNALSTNNVWKDITTDFDSKYFILLRAIGEMMISRSADGKSYSMLSEKTNGEIHNNPDFLKVWKACLMLEARGGMPPELVRGFYRFKEIYKLSKTATSLIPTFSFLPAFFIFEPGNVEIIEIVLLADEKGEWYFTEDAEKYQMKHLLNKQYYFDYLEGLNPDHPGLPKNIAKRKELETQRQNQIQQNDVFICNGNRSETYHSNSNCSGLQQCTVTISQVTISQAVNYYQRRPCSKCYH